MEPSNTINLKYNGKKVTLELPEKYEDFLKLIEDKFFLSKELMKYISINYFDEENYSNLVDDEESYEISLLEHKGEWEMIIDLQKLKDDDNSNNNKINENSKISPKIKNFDKNDVKKLEEKISKKYASIFKKKMDEKKIEYKNQMSKLENDFKNTMNTVLQKNEESYEQLSQYYNDKMKEYFQKYNDIVIENLNKGISQSELKELADQFFKENQIQNMGQNIINGNNQINGDAGSSFAFSRIINKK